MAKADSTALRAILARNVRLIRNKIGFNQEQLAGEAGLHRTYIGAIERAERNVSVDNIEKLAKALKVKPETLLMDEAK